MAVQVITGQAKYTDASNKSFNLRQLVMLSSALTTIEETHDVNILYKDALVEGKQVVSPDVTNENLYEVLGEVLADTQIWFVKTGARTLTLRPKGEPVAPAQAVAGAIHGTVSDAKTGDKLPGANVFIDGTKFGASSDLDGNFRIEKIPPGRYKLVCKFMGYGDFEADVNIRANDKHELEILLYESALAMDEIVVTGTGFEIRKEELSTPVATISTSEIELAPATSIDGLIQGRVAGARINSRSGSPGTGSRMMSRGMVSTSGATDPVIYVDGVRVDNSTHTDLALFTGGDYSSAISDILVEDIDRVEVTKSGAASTLYGSEAANGVIQIFTKRGVAGKTKITFRSDFGVDVPTTQFYKTRFAKEEVMSSGLAQKNSIGIQGGNERGTYYLNMNVKHADGIMYNTEQTLYSGQAGIRALFTDKVTFDASFGFVRDRYGRAYSAFGGDILTSVETGWLGVSFKDDIYDDPTALSAARNLYEDYKAGENNEETVNRTTASMTLRYDPFEILSNRITVGFDNRASEMRGFVPVGANPLVYGLQKSTGYAGSANRDKMILTLDYASTIKWSPFSKITSAFTFGAQGFREDINNSLMTGTGFGISGTEDIDNAAIVTANESRVELFNGGFYLNEQLGLLNKVFVNLGVRFDYNTAFGEDIGVQTYPKAGLAYSLSNEKFWKNSPLSSFWNDLKLRASWGKTGKFPSPFQRDKTFNVHSFMGQPAASFATAGNANLGPEITESLDFGFDTSLLNNRISLEFSYYTENTTDAIMIAPLDPTTGYNFHEVNLGRIENKGIELSINGSILRKTNVLWDVGMNFATLDNKVVDTGGLDPFSIGNFGSSMVMEGKPVGIFQTNKPTAALDGTFDTIHERSPLPDKYGSVYTNLTLWRKLTLSARGDWQTGGWLANTSTTWQYFFGGMFPDLVPAGYSWFTATDLFYDRSDYFKLREIVVRYNVGKLKKFPLLENIVLYASLRNVYTWHRVEFDNLDPETLQSFVDKTNMGTGGAFAISPPRSYRLGFEITL